MSAKRARSAPEGDAADPYDIIPDSFLERYPAADSIREALRMAEREAAASAEEINRRQRCPECGDTRIRKKLDSVAEQPERRPEDYKCWSCGEHFDRPAKSKYEQSMAYFERGRRVDSEPLPDEHEQVTLGEVGER